MSRGRGIRFERHLARVLRNNGVAIRVAASGAGGDGSPDILAGQQGKMYAIECKTTVKDEVGIGIDQHNAFMSFASQTGSVPLYVVKFMKRGVYLFTLKDIVVLNRSVRLKKRWGKKIDIKQPIRRWFDDIARDYS